MKITPLLTDEAVLIELGERLGRHRLDRNLSQAELAEAAGVSKRTIERIEAGDSTQLANFIRILRALDLIEGFDALIPPPPPSPIAQLKLHGRQRQRASSVREPAPSNRAWTWDDKQ
jgi:transcriptional regulator with XRE-family HTH domain